MSNLFSYLLFILSSLFSSNINTAINAVYITNEIIPATVYLITSFSIKSNKEIYFITIIGTMLVAHNKYPTESNIPNDMHTDIHSINVFFIVTSNLVTSKGPQPTILIYTYQATRYLPSAYVVSIYRVSSIMKLPEKVLSPIVYQIHNIIIYQMLSYWLLIKGVQILLGILS